MAYTDSTKVQNFLQRSLTQYETDLFDTVLAAVKAWIDKTLASTFDEVAATTRYFDGGVQNLDIDPCTAISAVLALADDGDTSYTYDLTTTPEVIAEPQNETVKRELRRRYGRFPRGMKRIAVTAKFSEYDSGVPGDIVLLATRLVAGVLQAGKNTGDGNISAESLEGHSVRYNDKANDIEGIAKSDPTVASILSSRRELLVDNSGNEPDHGYDDVL